MAQALKQFEKKKDFLLCVDSDGCAMDTMNIKHIRCFGPCFTDEWNIVKDREQVLKRWNEINLYEITRGINRFAGLSEILCELYSEDDNVKAFADWVKSAHALSEAAVEEMTKITVNPIFKKALSWSKAVNVSINALHDDDKKEFEGVAYALSKAKKVFDIAIVSSANYAAVTEEWERCGLLQHVDVVTTQTDGSKAFCIAELIKKGYDKDKVLMAGDAEGDLKAAISNGVCFYPILVNRETECWNNISAFLEKFIKGESEKEQKELIKEFFKNFGVEV